MRHPQSSVQGDSSAAIDEAEARKKRLAKLKTAAIWALSATAPLGVGWLLYALWNKNRAKARASSSSTDSTKPASNLGKSEADAGSADTAGDQMRKTGWFTEFMKQDIPDAPINVRKARGFKDELVDAAPSLAYLALFSHPTVAMTGVMAAPYASLALHSKYMQEVRKRDWANFNEQRSKEAMHGELLEKEPWNAGYHRLRDTPRIYHFPKNAPGDTHYELQGGQWYEVANGIKRPI